MVSYSCILLPMYYSIIIGMTCCHKFAHAANHLEGPASITSGKIPNLKGIRKWTGHPSLDNYMLMDSYGASDDSESEVSHTDICFTCGSYNPYCQKGFDSQFYCSRCFDARGFLCSTYQALVLSVSNQQVLPEHLEESNGGFP